MYQISQTLMFHRFLKFKRFTFQSADLKKKKILGLPTTRKLFCLVVSPGLSNISILMFHRFVYKRWLIFLDPPTPPRENYFVSSWPPDYWLRNPYDWEIYFKVWEIFSLAIWELERSIMWFWGPTHHEKIILSRRQPWSIEHLNLNVS